jgi:hypothetical protein
MAYASPSAQTPERFQERFGGEFSIQNLRPGGPAQGARTPTMRAGNRFAREKDIGRTLGQLVGMRS